MLYEKVRLILFDGTVIENLKHYDNSYRSEQPLDESIFKNNLFKVVEEIEGVEEPIIYHDLRFVGPWEVEGDWCFSLPALSYVEKKMGQILSNIQYLSMMTDVELPE